LETSKAQIIASVTVRFSGGSSQPRGAVHPYTTDLLSRLNYDVSQYRSKTWDEFAAPDAPVMDFVFTVCDQAAAEVCPLWPGQPMSAHWGLPDPVQATGNEIEQRLAFSEAYRMLRNRLTIFVSLPISSLDNLALQKNLDQIGRNTDKAAEA
jgi:protein-tyrosine-phosphatase